MADGLDSSWIDDLLPPEFRTDVAASLGPENYFVANPVTAPEDDWQDQYKPEPYDTTDWGAGTVAEVGGPTPGADGQSGSVIGNAIKGATGWIKDNKELASMIGSGIVGAVRDKNAREMSQAQIDYYKQRQADLNNSVKSYTRNPNQKV